MTKHDPTDEAETLPGIPIAGSDLEKFPSVPGIIGAGAQSIDIAVQEVASTGRGTLAAPVTVAIAAVVVARTYVTIKGSLQPPPTSALNFPIRGDTWSVVFELTNPTTISWWMNRGGGPTATVRFHVIEYL
jgi:hypothetical protein